jgi:hypothetical protein
LAASKIPMLCSPECLGCQQYKSRALGARLEPKEKEPRFVAAPVVRPDLAGSQDWIVHNEQGRVNEKDEVEPRRTGQNAIRLPVVRAKSGNSEFATTRRTGASDRHFAASEELSLHLPMLKTSGCSPGVPKCRKHSAVSRLSRCRKCDSQCQHRLVLDRLLVLGRPVEISDQDVILELAFHGAHHRGQIAMQAGYDPPGSTDFIPAMRAGRF